MWTRRRLQTIVGDEEGWIVALHREKEHERREDMNISFRGVNVPRDNHLRFTERRLCRVVVGVFFVPRYAIVTTLPYAIKCRLCGQVVFANTREINVKLTAIQVWKRVAPLWTACAVRITILTLYRETRAVKVDIISRRERGGGYYLFLLAVYFFLPANISRQRSSRKCHDRIVCQNFC